MRARYVTATLLVGGTQWKETELFFSGRFFVSWQKCMCKYRITMEIFKTGYTHVAHKEASPIKMVFYKGSWG